MLASPGRNPPCYCCDGPGGLRRTMDEPPLCDDCAAEYLVKKQPFPEPKPTPAYYPFERSFP